MPNVFSAGASLVRWEVTVVGAERPYRLGVYHPSGTIVEYFSSVASALEREQEIERLLKGGVRPYEPAAQVAGRS
jgi:hypothetical protein